LKVEIKQAQGLPAMAQAIIALTYSSLKQSNKDLGAEREPECGKVSLGDGYTYYISPC